MGSAHIHDVSASPSERLNLTTSYLTVNEVADRYRTTPRTVQRWIREGRLRAVRLPGGRSYRIDEADLAAIEASA